MLTNRPTSHTSSASTATRVDSTLNLPLILVLPSTLVGQPLEQWQQLVTQTIQPFTENVFLEWDWVNAELESITVDTFRELVTRLQFGVGPTTQRVVVILAADLAPVQAQNALLKSLEEPPARTTLVLAVTNPTSLLPTILSRCQLKYVAPDLQTAAEPLPATLIADLELLLQFSRQPAAATHSQLIQLASRYKDRVSAKSFLHRWLEYLMANPTTLNLVQLKLAQATLASLAQLDQNLSPPLVLEELWFGFKSGANV